MLKTMLATLLLLDGPVLSTSLTLSSFDAASAVCREVHAGKPQQQGLFSADAAIRRS